MIRLSRLSLLAIASLIFAVGCGGTLGGGSTLVLRDGSDGIHVSGEDRAEARPDRARFIIGVEARRPTVAEARDASAAAQTGVLDALRAAGVESSDLQTSQLSVQPEYEYTEQGQRLLGYTARNTVNVRVRSIDRLAEIVDGGLRAGGDDVRLNGISFEHSDPQALRAQAREQAMAQARATAEQLARLAGVELGEPLSVQEQISGEGGMPVPVMMRAASADMATPIEAGSTEVRVHLQVRWSIR